MKPTADQRRWQMVMEDPAAPEALKAQAARHLSIEVPASGSYSAELDPLVQGYSNTRADEILPRHPAAANVYHALNAILLLGGLPPIQDAAVCLLDAFTHCRSQWMQTQTASALGSIVRYHHTDVEPETLAAIEKAINA